MPTARLVFALVLPLTLAACGDDGDASPDTDASTGTTDGSTSATMTASNPTMSDATATLDPDSTGDDPDTTAPGTTTDEPGTTTDEPGTTTDEPGTSTDGTGTDDTGSSGESGGALEMCLGMIEDGDACGECACNECLPELTACEADEGCTAIRVCAQEAMCSGLGCLGPCGDVIDANGGILGMSAAIAQTLGDCIGMSCEKC